MDSTGYVSLSLSSVMRRSINIAANNMANANTSGFKGERPMFDEYLHRQPNGEKVSFVLDGGSYMNTAQGGLSQTGNPLDVAVEGAGWMGYQNDEGRVVFGRDGRLTIDNEGNLVTFQGNQVLDAGGAPIAIPADVNGEIAISEDGTISDDQGNAISQVGVFDIQEIQSYERLGGGMFGVPEGAGAPQFIPELNTKVVQGFLEGSNVQPIVEITRMMNIQKSYERSVKMTENHNDLRKNTLGRLGRPA